MSDAFKSPILFLIFNRAALTRTVFEKIKEIRPEKLYIGCDGPRKHIPDDEARVKECRGILDQIDWPCAVHTRYLDENVGSKIALREAISWFFEHEESGIILEDDCVPSLDFFHFTEKMLLRHKDDEMIGMVSGTSYRSQVEKPLNDEDDYFFSRYCHVWGWATWATRWQQHFDPVDNKHEPEERVKKAFENMGVRNPFVQWYWRRAFRNHIFTDVPNWDYRWMMSCWERNKLAIIPKVNLVSNIGHSEHATRTKWEDAYASAMPTYTFPPPFRAPERKLRSKSYDRFYDFRIIIWEWSVLHEARKLRTVLREKLKRFSPRRSID